MKKTLSKLTLLLIVIPIIGAAGVRVSNGEMNDGRFMVYENGTVKDTKTDLMWWKCDNNADITWTDAKRLCEKFSGGGYKDWRMPTIEELEGLYRSDDEFYNIQGDEDKDNIIRYKRVYLTKKIQLSTGVAWSDDGPTEYRRWSFLFGSGTRDSREKSFGNGLRVLPVRSCK